MKVSPLKSFRRPGLWLSLWLIAVTAMIVICLMPPPPLALPNGGDKIEHFIGYFVLAAAMIQVFALPKWRIGLTLALIAMGVMIELAQGALTSTRIADPYDALANLLGTLAGSAMAFTPFRDSVLNWERRWIHR